MDKKLINSITKEFKNKFSMSPTIVRSPGRINLIGEHIDYNDGLVFPATIDKCIIVAIAKSESNISKVLSVDFNESFELDFNNLNKQEDGSWKNYVIGVVSGLIEKGCKLENFNLVFGGNIPIGAGLSSSAALEDGIVYGLNHIFDLNLNLIEIMNISIEAEHNFAGVNCGVMDQFSNLHGKKENAILLDCSDLSFSHIPAQLGNNQLLLINTNVKHQLSNSPYNQRKQACKTGLKTLQEKYPDIPSLSKASLEELDSVKNELSSEVYNRCKYVIEENQRVKDSKVALINKDWEKFGNLLFSSHEGLSTLYEVSCKELDFLVDLAKESPRVLGSRMMGGGFGGCTINLIKKDGLDNFIKESKEKYLKKFGISADAYTINIIDGVKVIES